MITHIAKHLIAKTIKDPYNGAIRNFNRQLLSPLCLKTLIFFSGVLMKFEWNSPKVCHKIYFLRWPRISLIRQD